MKKFSTISGALLSAVMVIVIFAACQKEQSPVSENSTAAVSSEQIQINGVAGSYGEIVTGNYAAALASNYYRKYSDDNNKPQYVAFDAATLSAFIAKLQKNGSTKIYVNFGVYGRGADAPNPKDNGKLTVFFTGSKIPAPSIRYKDSGFTDGEEFLNHGEMFP